MSELERLIIKYYLEGYSINSIVNYVEGMNLPGWHIHFLSKDFKLGGHILNVSSNNALVKINKLDTWEVLMPENKNFAKWNLKEDLKEKTEAVEGNSKK